MYNIRKKFSIGNFVTSSDLVKEILNVKTEPLQNYDSFVVTNPDLVDEGIDVSGLRTTTDTRQELLSDVPDYAGIQFDPTVTSYLDDLYSLYSGQLPMTPTATTPAVGSPTDEGGGGGVGVETPATITPSTPITTDLTDDQINEFVTEDTTMPPMLSPDMIGDIDTTPVDTTPPNMSPLADEQFVGTDSGLDYFDMNLIDNPFAGTPVNTPSGNNPLGLEDPQSLAIGPSGAVDFGTGGLEDEGQAVGEEFAGTPVNTPSGNNPFGLEDPQSLANQEFARQNTGLENLLDQAEATDAEIYGEPLDAEDYLGTSTPQEINIDTQVVSNPSAVNTILGSDGITYDAVTGNPIYEDLDAQAAATSITPETESALSQAFRTGKEALDSGMQTISQVGQSIADSVKGTYDDLNKKVNVPGLGEISVIDTLAGLAINAAVGAPVSFVKYAMDQMPKSTSQLAYDAYTPTQQAIVDKEFGPGGLLDGYNEVSAFGKDAKGIAEDALDQRLDNVGIDKRTLDLADLVESLGGDVPSSIESTLSGDINPEGTGDASVAESIAAANKAAETAAEVDATSIELGEALHGGEDSSETSADERDTFGGVPGVPDAIGGTIDQSDDFDDGTMTGDAADSVDDVLGPMPDTPAPPSNPNAQEGADEGGGNDVGGTGTAAAADTSQGETGYGSCFIAGTKISMADGTLKNIEDVVVGDKVKGHKEENTVIKLDPTLLGDRKLYSFNNNKHHFFTSEHPFMTEEGWKSIKPEKTKERDGVELYEQLKGELKVGDKLVTDNNSIEITNIDSKEMNNPEMPLYNFNVSNDNSYIADSYVVHNKGGDGCFLAGTLVTMADGSTKPVEQVDLKDNVAEGGKVFATGKFLIENLYDYKGIKVSGSHMVHEDDNWVRVEDSKHGKPLGNDEHTVYVFGSENRRILIDGILFTDYFEVNEQNILIKDSEDFFNNSKNYGKIIDKQNVDILNAS